MNSVRNEIRGKVLGILSKDLDKYSTRLARARAWNILHQRVILPAEIADSLYNEIGQKKWIRYTSP